MSTTAKWLLIALLLILVHAVYVVATGVIVGPDGAGFVFPFGTIMASNAGSFAVVEMLLAGVLLIGFSLALRGGE